jgi:hypothetical protein
MRSSTSRPGSLNTRRLVVALVTLVGAPLIWLTALQSGYVLAYQACASRYMGWVMAPTLVAIALSLCVLAAGGLGLRGIRHERQPLAFLARLGFGMAGLMVVVLVTSAIAPAILQPCD